MTRLIIAALALSLLISAIAWGGGVQYRYYPRRRYSAHHSLGLFRLAGVRRR